MIRLKKHSLFKANNKIGTINFRIKNEHDVERKTLDPSLKNLAGKNKVIKLKKE